jgi:tetratricopeptide (TPR) repeat protein
VTLQSKSSGAYFNLGLVFAAQGRHEEAAAAYRAAVRLKPDYAEAHYNLGLTWTRLQQTEEAIAAYRAAVQARPSFAMAHNNLGSIYLRKRDFPAAVVCFRAALRHQPDHAQASFNLGIALQLQGNAPEAITAYRDAVRLNRNNAQAHYNLGILLHEQGQLEEAAAVYRAAVKAQPDYAEAWCSLGRTLHARGQLAEALTAFRRGDDLGRRRPHWPYPSAEWVRGCERLLELEPHLPPIARGEVDPVDADLGLEFAVLCAVKQQPAAAARLYAWAFTADPRLAAGLSGHRYQAARVAALAAAGQGDGASLDEREKGRWRGQALAWLRADLALWIRQFDSGNSQVRERVIAKVSRWRRDRNLAGVRDAEALARLPEAERQAWRKFWGEVDGFLTRVQGERKANAP